MIYVVSDLHGNYEKFKREKVLRISESGKDTFVVYHPGNYGEENGYGYVMNLLIGFNEMQTALLDAKKAENKKAKKERAYTFLYYEKDGI